MAKLYLPILCPATVEGLGMELKGAAAKSWATRYISGNLKALSGVMGSLTPEEVVNSLRFIDRVVMFHTGQDSSKFLAQ